MRRFPAHPMPLSALDAELVVMPSSPPSATRNVSPKMKTSASSSHSLESQSTSGTAANVGVLGRLPGSGKPGGTSSASVTAEAPCWPKLSPKAFAKLKGAAAPGCCWCSPSSPAAGAAPATATAARALVGIGATIGGGAVAAGKGKAGKSPSIGATPSPPRTAAAATAEAVSGVAEALKPESHAAAGLGVSNCQGLSGTAVDAGVASGVDLFHESV
mmetsp:Transcript_30980/g.78336  ORF Transcript_30980/g.78336 Transcript_30980/m.78336 type:complete len:216 (-) Transcript_30980:374-1021(-)